MCSTNDGGVALPSYFMFVGIDFSSVSRCNVEEHSHMSSYVSGNESSKGSDVDEETVRNHFSHDAVELDVLSEGHRNNISTTSVLTTSPLKGFQTMAR